MAEFRGVQIGQGNTQINQFHLHPPATEWPVRVGVVPPLADCRQARAADRELAAAGTTVVLGQVVAGLGGVGKTQLAASLAHGLWRDSRVDLLVWVNATARDNVVAAYGTALEQLTGVAEADPQRGAERFLAWLAATARPWLLVLDDLGDPNHLLGLWPPTGGTGRTVVTTRRTDAALRAGRQLIQVGVFTPDESLSYLTGKLAGRPGLAEGAAGLAADLGQLPLALSQAAAYLLDQDITCAQYAARLDRRPLRELLPDALPDDYAATVATTWSVSIALADRRAPAGLARPLLELAALLDPNGMPIDVFTSPAVTLACTAETGRDVDADDTRDALRLLHKLSLLTLDEQAEVVTVHMLVQRVVRESLDAAGLRRRALTAAYAMHAIWPEVERGLPHAQQLRAGVQALRRHAGDVLLLDGAHPVLFRLGLSLGRAGLVAAAAAEHARQYEDCLRVLGPDHTDTLEARANEAGWRGRGGDQRAAAAQYDQVLEAFTGLLGPDDPRTLKARANTLHWHGQAGDPARAAEGFGTLVEDAVRVLGPDSTETLAMRQNLVFWRGQAGDPAGAYEATSHLLEDYRRVLGPDHPDTLSAIGNKGHWLARMGDHAGAAEVLRLQVSERARVFGADHPETLNAGVLRAWSCGLAGDPGGAVAALSDLLAAELRVLDHDHPYVFAARLFLAEWQGRNGDPATAVAQLEAHLPERIRSYGPDDPRTAVIRRALTKWRAASPAGPDPAS